MEIKINITPPWRWSWKKPRARDVALALVGGGIGTSLVRYGVEDWFDVLGYLLGVVYGVIF